MTLIDNQGVEFFYWFAQQDDEWRSIPWLVLGKGPTFAQLCDFDTNGYHKFGLNHVVMECRLEIAHMIDINVVHACASKLQSQSNCLVMPWIPHVENKPGTKTLEQWIREIPVLGVLAAQKRLLWYNKQGSPPRGTSPPVRVVNFSAEAPYALLGMAGATTIRTLGIDGGATYAAAFSGLPTLLMNGRDSFESQFAEIAHSIQRYRLDAAPLDRPAPMRVYVAASQEQALSVSVLEYSIRKHASMSVQVMPLYHSCVDIPVPKDAANLPRTPFSFQRFLIPELAGYQGRAIYLDSDMQVFGDIRSLWQIDMEGSDLLSVAPASDTSRIPQYSVMLLDCAQLDWHIGEIVAALDAGHFTYEELMQRMVIAEKQSASIDTEWNSLERYTHGVTKLLHYTDMQTQPWVHALHPLGKLWVGDLLEAVDSGAIAYSDIVQQVERGWVRPSLIYQLERRIVDARLLPRNVLDLDDGFRAPYRSLPSARPVRGMLDKLRALTHHVQGLAYVSLRAAKRWLIAKWNSAGRS